MRISRKLERAVTGELYDLLDPAMWDAVVDLVDVAERITANLGHLGTRKTGGPTRTPEQSELMAILNRIDRMIGG